MRVASLPRVLDPLAIAEARERGAGFERQAFEARLAGAARAAV